MRGEVHGQRTSRWGVLAVFVLAALPLLRRLREPVGELPPIHGLDDRP